MCRNDIEVFEKLCELTVPALGGDVELPVFSLNYCDRWVELIQFWNENYCGLGGPGFLFPVLYKIRYDEYPLAIYSESQLKIFELLENQIKTNVKAHRTWMKSEVFERAAEVSLEEFQEYFSWVHFEYMVDRTDCDIYSFMRKKEEDGKESWYHIYEKLIRRLLPEADSWNKMDWLKGECILNGLEEKYDIEYISFDYDMEEYGMDYYDMDEDYGALIMLLKKIWYEGCKPSVRDVLEVKTCSEKLASMIWTVDMKEQLVNMFAEAVELAREGTIKSKLVTDSWLYRQVQAWYDDGFLDTDLYKVAKKAVFDAITTLA